MADVAAIRARWADERTFGQRVRAARKAAGLTLAQVADRVGVTVQYISDIEHNARLAWLYRQPLAEALGFRWIEPTEHARQDVAELLAALAAAEARARALEAERPGLVEVVACLEALCACYRLGKRPTEKLWRRLDAVEALRAALAGDGGAA